MDETLADARRADRVLPAPSPVSWPLVERRRGPSRPPPGDERRARSLEDWTALNPIVMVPLWPIRLAAAGGAIISAILHREMGALILGTTGAVYVVYTVAALVHPIPYRDDTRVRLRIVVEQMLCVAMVLVTGAWSSPFVVCVLPATMLAGMAAGAVFAVEVAACSSIAITVQHIATDSVRDGLWHGAIWTGFLGLVVLVGGFVHRSTLEAARRQWAAQTRLSTLTEANSLLFELQQVAQTMPASLDLDEVLDSTVARIQELFSVDVIAVLLLDRSSVATPVRTVGIEALGEFTVDELPVHLRRAMGESRPLRCDHLLPGEAVSPGAASGLYAVMRGHGQPIGLVAVESLHPNAFDARHIEVLHGLADPFGVAIDNARIFRQLRLRAADEERSRIARDLHDHIGSSLATIGFEVDRAVHLAHDPAKIEPVLRDLRSQVTAVVTDVRETLFDLRSDLTDSRDLRELLDEYVRRVALRSALTATMDVVITGRLPLMFEREIWQIVREAINNVERHAQATSLHVFLRESATHVDATVSDDGLGITNAPARHDSYGMQGMRERADRIGAILSTRPPASGGTEVRLELELEEGNRSWDSR